MPQSLSSSMQGYYGSDRAVEEVEPHVHASASQQPRLPHFPSYNLGQFLSIEGAPPLGFREPIPIAERIDGAKNAIRGFDGQMSKG
ncbi:hypothetical protein DID88_000524 [Monilinia fructigena]|uniref:Uncharacterized protein n=1 Tax=Monilinia fructigena TaxID=38457 RepID=A0A395IHS2_9HELO|nr:hypothetical protein DID88_000524 [Monilinia fructigena]